MSGGFKPFEHAEVAQQRSGRTDQTLADAKRGHGVAVDQHHGMPACEDARRRGARRPGADDQHVRGEGYRDVSRFRRAPQVGGSWGNRPRRSVNPVGGRARNGAPATMAVMGAGGAAGL